MVKRKVIAGTDPMPTINYLTRDSENVEIIDQNNITEDLYLHSTEEVVHHIGMIKQHDDFRYNHLSKKEREADIKPIRNSKNDPKIGRNDLCPCGSGKKYKRCCMPGSL
jgi:uncharacterized protein YecA (UPF0149 family)